MNTKTRHTSAILARLPVFAALFALAGSGPGEALAANVTVDLCATTGSISLPATPSAISVPIYGYVMGNCSVSPTVSAPGGPVIDVNVGDVVTVNLNNSLPNATGLLFQGQALVPDTTGAAAGATKPYTFTATNPGTFLYEAALLPNAEYQAAMGLHGALIVRAAPAALTGGVSITPVGGVARTDTAATYSSGSNVVTDTAVLDTDVGAAVTGAGIPVGTTITAVTAGASFTMSHVAGVAYGATTDFNEEATLVLSEIDPALNSAAAAFDMRNFAPKYFLINGKPYPNTDPIPSAAGHKVLLRYVNAGVKHHSMSVLGLRQNFVAKDGSPLPTLNHNVAAETLAPGQTGDAIATIPASATTASKFAVYDASLALHNSNAAGFGGMLTFVTAGTGSAVTGPVTSNVAISPNPSNGSAQATLTARITPSTGATLNSAEYFVDAIGVNGSGCLITGASGASAVNVSVSIPTAGATAPCVDLTLPSGNHTLYVHGRDDSGTTPGTWGAVSSTGLNLDKTGPVTSGLTLTPNPSSGTVGVALGATGNDSATGGSNITAAEYTIDGGAAVAMTLGGASAPVRSLTATIPAGLSAGAHTVAVRSQDTLGNWGTSAPIALNVVSASGGPVTSNVSASPNPNNGALPLNASQPVVRVMASIASTTGSTVVAGEGFIDSNPAATVRGFPFTPSDGAWNGATETVYADIPLGNIGLLSVGSHSIFVRGKDAVGNWGATTAMTLVIDKTAPTVSSASVTPSASNNAPVTINGTGTDTACTPNICVLGGGEFYIDAAGAAGTGTAMVATSATTFSGTIPNAALSPLAAGNHRVYVRARDAAGNWSANTVFATLLIDRTAPTFSSITLAPNSTAVGTPVNLSVNGAGDPLVGGLASGLAGGEWWIGSTNITAGTGTAFVLPAANPVASIPTASLLPGCTYTVRTRIRDVATNWSTGNNGVRTAPLTITGTPADAIFADGFEAGDTNAWTSRSTNSTTRLNTSTVSAMVGTVGLQAQGNNTNYVQYNFGACPPAAPTFDARFYFRPNGNTSTGKDIFVAASNTNFSNANTLFRVRYRLNGTTPQVQIQVGTANTNTTWTNILGSTSNNVIEVVKQANGSLTLYVNQVSAQTLTASTASVTAVRLGSVTNTGNATLMYFDAFASKRSVTPLIGP